MLIGVETPGPGRWEVTGRYRGSTLSHVVEVVGPVGR